MKKKAFKDLYHRYKLKTYDENTYIKHKSSNWVALKCIKNYTSTPDEKIRQMGTLKRHKTKLTTYMLHTLHKIYISTTVYYSYAYFVFIHDYFHDVLFFMLINDFHELN